MGWNWPQWAASSCREVKRQGEILFEELWRLCTTLTTEPGHFYEEQLDRMRRLDLARVRTHGQDLLMPLLQCRQLRGELEKLPALKSLTEREAKKVLQPLWRKAGGAGDIPQDVVEDLRTRKRSPTRAAISLVAKAQNKSPDSLHSLFNRWRLDPSSDDMFPVDRRDPAWTAPFVDFEPAPRKKRPTDKPPPP